MRTLLRFIGAAALSLGLVFIALQNAVAADRNILVFGDSLSAAYGIRPEQGWVALLTQRLQAQGYGYQIINASVSGETTEGGLERLPRALQLHQPGVVVLELGANDALRGLPLSVTRTNLSKMIELAQGTGARILLVGIRIPPNYGPRYTEELGGYENMLAHHRGLAITPEQRFRFASLLSRAPLATAIARASLSCSCCCASCAVSSSRRSFSAPA